MKKFLIYLLFPLLCACNTKMLSVVDEGAFSNAVSHMPEILYAYSIIDENNYYMQSYTNQSLDDVGQILYEKLNSNFSYPNIVNNEHTSFAKRAKKGDKVKFSSTGFHALQGVDIIDTNIIAVADFNSDGQEDWLILSSVYQIVHKKKDLYYLLVEDIYANELDPLFLSSYDVDAKLSLSLEEIRERAKVTDRIQGQDKIIEPPNKTKALKNDNLNETKLSN